MQWDNTKEWSEVQQGIDYNTRLGLYSKNTLNWNMYNGNQWVGVQTNGLSKWTFNICRTVINYFIAFICSQKVKMQYSAENIPDEPQDDEQMQTKEFCKLLSDMADMKWEKDKMDSKLRQLMLDGAVSGDFAAYVYWDPKKETGQIEKGDFTTEVVDGINVMFGNPNNPNVEAQPYISIYGREIVSKLKEEAKANKIQEDMIARIISDQDTDYQAGANAKEELDNHDDNGKCNFVIKFYKKDGKVFWNKSTRYCPIRKEVDLGISRYPVAFGNWETIKNSYHGMPVIEGIIDNQISINQLFAMVSYWMKMSAFGKVIYDKTKINSWNNAVGSAIGADGEVNNIVYQLQAGNFNAAVLQVIEMAINYTKEFIGASDSLLGQVNPEQASGTAIISTAKQASMPLGNISANRDQFVEDLGLIWGEFFLKKYQNRTVAYKDDDKVMTTEYSTEGKDNILLYCKVDVGPSNYFSELIGIQYLDKLLDSQQINKLQYFQRIAKMNIIPDVQGLIADTEEEMAQMQQQTDQNAQYEQMAQFVESLPPDVQEQLKALPPEQMEQAVIELMQQSQTPQ